MLITGCDGFIGTHLKKALQGQVEIIGVDKRSGTDVLDLECLEVSSLDYIVHLAAQTSVFNKNEEALFRDNVEAFRKVVQYSNRNRVKLVYASSSCSVNRTSLYGLTKFIDEEYARMNAKYATGIRFHNIYGRNPRPGTLLYNLLNQEETVLYNNGENMRHYTYVGDAVESIKYALNSSRPLVNCCNPEETSVLDFAKEVMKRADKVRIRLEERKRDLDKVVQYVDDTVPLVELDYTPLCKGLDLSIL